MLNIGENAVCESLHELTEREGIWHETKVRMEVCGSQYIFNMTVKKLSLQVAIWEQWGHMIIILY